MAAPAYADVELCSDDDLDRLSSAASSSSGSSASSHPPSLDAPPPPLPAAIPAAVLHRLVALNLADAGFTDAEPDALQELEGALASCTSSSAHLLKRSP